jgi:hypothetical protein
VRVNVFKPGTSLLLLAVLWMAGSQPVYAGGPLLVRNTGDPFLWSTAAEIQYRTDNGPLSATVNEATAQTRVIAMFQVWEDVATANIGYSRQGFINAVGAFGGGDVNTVGEFNAVEGDCGNQSPIIYDADAAIFMGLGVDETSVIGFAGPCATQGSQIVGGEAVMNGLFQDGDGGGTPNVPDLSTAEFDAAFIHEFGHFSGLDHSQINLNCLNAFPCTADDQAGLPTMFPILIFASQGSLSDDDIAWISKLYPSATFNTTHGTINGIVFFTDGQSHAQDVNVIARRVDAGNNEDRRNAVSVVSGFRFTTDQDNPIAGSGGSNSGSLDPGDIGFYEIPVPAGNYTIEVESIDPGFTGGSSVGPFDFPIPMPGTAPAPSAMITVTAGNTNADNGVVLIGTPPRFDQFEGP